MKLLTEVFDEVELLTEETNAGRKHYLEGRFMQGGREGVREDMNKNGRIYLADILENAANKYITDYVRNKRSLGELNHPPSPQVNPERVCMVVEKLTKDGLHFNGKARITEGTPMGQIVIGILDAGGRLGVSTRALGSLSERNGIKYVQKDLMFSAVDCVSDPSGNGCFSNYVNENINYEMTNDGRIIELVVDTIVRKKLDESKFIVEFARLMNEFGK